MNFLSNLMDSIAKIIPKIPVAIFDLLIGWLLISIANYVIRHSVKLLRIPRDLRGLIITVSKLAMWVILVIYIASVLGLGNLALLLSGSAVVLVFFLNTSVGPLLSDIFSGLFLISDPDFKVGMHVSVEDGKTEGVVKGIDMRKVRILGKDGKLRVVPNNIIERGTWKIIERNPEKKGK